LLKYYRHQFNFVCALSDLAVLLVAFFSAYLARRDLIPFLSPVLARRPVFGLDQYIPVLILSGFVILACLFATGAYRSHPGVPFSRAAMRDAKAMLYALLLTLALAFLLKLTFMSRTFLVLYLCIFYVLSSLAKHVLARWFRARARAGKNIRMVLLVGAGHQAQEVARRLLGHPELGLRLRGFLRIEGEDLPGDEAAMASLGVPCLGESAFLADLVQREVVDGVVFTGQARVLGRMEELFLILEDLGVETLVAANLFPHLIAQVELERLEELPLLRFTTVPHNHLALFLKRVMDVAGAFLALLVLSPLFVLLAALIKLTSKGPVFFSQERMGLNGRRFRCHKFRTMVADAEKRLQEVQHLNEVDGPVFKMKRDPRVTAVGRLLRKTSLDELPQLWNVLVGEMSLVGPRPPIPGEVEKYERWQRRRLSMRPGITCLWQISGRSNLDFDTWMKLDLQYIDDWSLTLDLVILLKTVPAVLSAKGAA
jgi:exopolysaccharide biosynthesis polyprenyl glycosylphosphotransferase